MKKNCYHIFVDVFVLKQQIPGNFGLSQYNATLTANLSSQQPSTSVTIKMVYSEYYSGTEFNYHLDNLNVTNVKT